MDRDKQPTVTDRRHTRRSAANSTSSMSTPASVPATSSDSKKRGRKSSSATSQVGLQSNVAAMNLKAVDESADSLDGLSSNSTSKNNPKPSRQKKRNGVDVFDEHLAQLSASKKFLLIKFDEKDYEVKAADPLEIRPDGDWISHYSTSTALQPGDRVIAGSNNKRKYPTQKWSGIIMQIIDDRKSADQRCTLLKKPVKSEQVKPITLGKRDKRSLEEAAEAETSDQAEDDSPNDSIHSIQSDGTSEQQLLRRSFSPANSVGSQVKVGDSVNSPSTPRSSDTAVAPAPKITSVKKRKVAGGSSQESSSEPAASSYSTSKLTSDKPPLNAVTIPIPVSPLNTPAHPPIHVVPHLTPLPTGAPPPSTSNPAVYSSDPNYKVLPYQRAGDIGMMSIMPNNYGGMHLYACAVRYPQLLQTPVPEKKKYLRKLFDLLIGPDGPEELTRRRTERMAQENLKQLGVVTLMGPQFMQSLLAHLRSRSIFELDFVSDTLSSVTFEHRRKVEGRRKTAPA